MKKIRTEQESSLRGISTFPISKKPDPETSGIGAVLRKKEKRILAYLKCRIVAKKVTLSSLALLVSFTTFLQFLPQARITSISAEADTTYVMNVDLNEYAINTQDSSYYAWHGKVNLTGRISTGEVLSGSMAAYLDDLLTPLFQVDALPGNIVDSKYNFAAQIDTTKYVRGYHTLRIYDGTIASPGAKTPILTVPVYFEYSEIATITNVTTDCNMRETATTDSAVVIAVPLGATVEVLGQVIGQYRSEYGSNVWCYVRYEKNNNSYIGYILSTFIRKMTTGISMMKVTAANSVIEPFLAGKASYELNLPYSAYDLSIADLVMYNKEDTLEVYLNSVKIDFSFKTIPLTTGTNKVEFKTISASDATVLTYTYNIWRIAESTESEFQAQLALFPESYKPALRVLHSRYPDWLFTAFNTGLDWTAVVDRQDSGETSLIGRYSLPEYKYDDVPVETNFVLASRAAIEYYLDSRNFFSERQIFQFEQLSYNAAMHTLEGIRRILANSGLAGMENMFLKAGVESKVSPFHLAARSRQEVTVWNPIGLSSIATGTYNGGGGIYLGYYNFYNIGTGANIDHDVVIQNGLSYAMGTNAEYDLPWNSQEKAIVGGGKYIGKNYINAGQDTLYLQKFDVDNKAFGLYWHQYMQNVEAPESEASNTYVAYAQIGMLSNSFIFRIPVYLNMPQLTSPKPEDTNKLNTLGITGYTLTPGFDTSSDTVYHATVPAATEKITLTATTLNSNAAIAGTGEKSLVFGDGNTFVVSCTPTNGVQRDYTIQVTRNYPERSADNYLSTVQITGTNEIAISPNFNPDRTGPYAATVPTDTDHVTFSAIPQSGAATLTAGNGSQSLALGMNEISVTVRAENGNTRTYAFQITRTIPKATSSVFTMNNGTIAGIPVSTTADVFKSRIDASIATMRLFDISGNECSGSTILGTGMTLRVYYGDTLLEEHVVLIYGDINGDGKVNSTDITILKRYILKLSPITGKFLDACDVNRDGKFNSTDYTIIKRYILKLQEISQT